MSGTTWPGLHSAPMHREIDALTGERRPSKFFTALKQADERIAAFDRNEWEATFAPPVQMGGYCPCGSVFEARQDRIELTTEERAAVTDALGGLDVGDIVVGAINDARDRANQDAFAEWSDTHAYCGGDDL